jgi:hypothetical protein
MADEHDFVTAQAGKAAIDGGIVAEETVAVNLAEFPTDQVDVVPEEGPLGVPGYLDGFPGAEVVVGLAKQRGVVIAKLAKFLGVVDLLFDVEGFKLTDLLFEDRQGAFKLEHVARAAVGT